MINHSRNLLLNRSGDFTPSPGYLAEYVDPDFRALTYPASLTEIRSAIIPPGCDAAFADFRMRQCFFAIHSTEYGDSLKTYDPRITYLRDRAAGVAQALAVAEPLNAAARSAQATLLGRVAVAGSVKLTFEWTVECFAFGLVTAVDPSGRRTSATGSFTGGAGPVLGLPGHPTLAVQVMGSPEPTGAAWRVTAFSPPDKDLSDLPDDIYGSAGGSVETLLADPGTVPVWRDLWRTHPMPVYRLTGLLLSWIRKAEEVRLAGG